MAVNYFGFPQKLARFDAYCQQHGAILIEDNAHGLFSRDTDNARLGHRGDAGIFSIRKTIPLPSGAAVVYRDCHESGKAMPVHFSTVDVHYLVKLVLRVLMYAGGPRIVGLGLSAIRGMRKAIRGEAIPASDPEGRYKMPSPATCSPLMKKIFEFIDEKQETQRRRHLYQTGRRIFPLETECRPVFPSLPAAVCPYAFPFYCEDRPFKTVERKLLDKGLLCITWPNLPVEAPAESHDHYRSTEAGAVPVVEAVSKPPLSPYLGVGPDFQILEILQYVCGFKTWPAVPLARLKALKPLLYNHKL
jgi:hypothetical protein